MSMSQMGGKGSAEGSAGGAAAAVAPAAASSRNVLLPEHDHLLKPAVGCKDGAVGGGGGGSKGGKGSPKKGSPKKGSPKKGSAPSNKGDSPSTSGATAAALSAIEENLERAYLENFIKANEDMPGDVQRKTSQLLEISRQQSSFVKLLSTAVDGLMVSSEAESPKYLKELERLLILTAQVGDEMAGLAQGIDCIVSDQTHALNRDAEKLKACSAELNKLNAKNNPVVVEQAAAAAAAAPSGSTQKPETSAPEEPTPGPSSDMNPSKKQQSGPKSLLAFDALSAMGGADPDFDWSIVDRSCKYRNPPNYVGMCQAVGAGPAKKRKASRSGGGKTKGTDKDIPPNLPLQQPISGDDTKKEGAGGLGSGSGGDDDDDDDAKKDHPPPALPVPAKNGRDANAKENSNANANANAELLYCFCRKVSYGNMVLCENGLCPYEWFHFPCVNMKKAPSEKTKWHCPLCRGRSSKTMKPQEVLIKQLEQHCKAKWATFSLTS